MIIMVVSSLPCHGTSHAVKIMTNILVSADILTNNQGSYRKV